jgi:hypothetical protein
MKNLKLILIIALAVIFVGITFTAIFGGGKMLGQIFKAYIFKYEQCDYKAMPLPIAREPESISIDQVIEKECYIDYNQAKKDIAEGLALLIITIPVIYLSQKGLKQAIKGKK